MNKNRCKSHFNAIGFIALTMLCFSFTVMGKGNHIMAKKYYLREADDQIWQLRISGKISSLCGIYVIIYDKNKKVIFNGEVPGGNYPITKPYVVNIPKDGITGDYAVKIIGAQDDYMKINLPISTLPEVYYMESTTIGHDKNRKVHFKVPEDKEIIFSAYKNHLEVKDSSGKVVADTRNGKYGGSAYKAKFRYCNYIPLKCKKGEVYTILPQSFYFRSNTGLYVMFKADGWFVPNQQLDKIKWWKLELKK